MPSDDICVQIRKYAAARAVCGKRNKGDVLLDEARAEILKTRDLVQRIVKGPEYLSAAERRHWGVKSKKPSDT